MTPADIQLQLQLPYDRERWLKLLKALLPGTEVLRYAQALPAGYLQAKSAAQIARIPLAEDRIVAVLEVEVAGQVDLLRNRVGLRNLVARFIDQHSAHAVLGFFRGDSSNDGDYRMSFVAKSSELSADGQLSQTETDKRRYTYILGRGQPCRTPAERLELLRKHNGDVTLENLIEAFKVEPLFKEFFRDYGRVFSEVEALIKPTLPDKEMLRLFTQRLFNRLMFLAFIERKGWVQIGRRTDYLSALWDTYADRRTADGTFYRNHLVPLFFEGLNQPDRQPRHTDPRFGSVPYLNGGLFEKAGDGSDDHAAIIVPDKALESILTELFARYNFTVAESTPLDVVVAVDPEMLGKVFEELVTGRHEQGSYYTSKPIVSFMCREALIVYLTSNLPHESADSIVRFVELHDPIGLRNPEGVLDALKRVKVCDLACGSGAYLVGMLHELFDLRACLFAAKNLDSISAYQRKLEIIQNNLYGVDLDPFAVNIARLRLWLTLAVEFEGDEPPPLPNLDFKIEQGNSLAAPAPADVFRDAGSLPLLLPTVRDFAIKKGKFLTAHGVEKEALRTEIAGLKKSLKTWLATLGPADAFHWALEFAEVFLPVPAGASITVGLNIGLELAAAPQRGGFDIIVANPPYVRMELIKPQKPILRRRFPQVHAERADLYVYFYARAQELLREGGVAAFISSNKWLRAGYGESLRQHLLDAQNFRLVMDFGELGVFESAATDAAIFLWQKQPRADAVTRWAMVKDLKKCYAEGVRKHFLKLAVDVPASQFGEGKPRLATSATADLRTRMEKSGPRLGELFPALICWGIKTGLNEAFIIPQSKRDELVAETPEAAEIIKPLLVGDDVRRYETHYRGDHLIYAFHGLDIRRYPSIERHLRHFRTFKDEKGKKVGLDHRATEQEWFELQQPSPRLVPILEAPKLLYPIIGKECRFVLDAAKFYVNDKVFILPTADCFLLAVLNSASTFAFLKETCVTHGDKDAGGRLEFRAIYLETLPIPAANDLERATVSGLAEQSQVLHNERRTRVERFLRDLGLAPAQSTSRNPLEQPWKLSAVEFAARAKRQPLKLYEAARDETAALTEQIAKLEAEIDARVAALYGLDAEDRRWAAQASSASKPDDKQALFFSVLSGLKERRPYFRLDEIQKRINEEELALKDSSLKVYLSEAVKQGHIHDAGRGWYSSLSEPVPLDPKPVAKLIRAVEKAFPLLDFTVWSTAQINPWMHHLLAQPVAFLHASADALESIGDELRAQGWDVAVNPPPSAGPQAIHPGEKMVVLRPALTKQPPSQGRQDSLEKVLVDLVAETQRLPLMDQSEAESVVREILSRYLVQLAEMQSYAKFRKLKSSVFE